MNDLPADVVRAVELKLDGVERQLGELPLEKILEDEDLGWSFDLEGGWHMFVEVNNATRRLNQDSLDLDLVVSVGRRLARPRMHRRVQLPRAQT